MTVHKPKGAKLKEFMASFKGDAKKLVESSYRDPTIEAPKLSTGYLTLDEFLNGGIRAGTWVELYGGESVGKTTLAIHLMAQCQKLWGRPVAFLDFEHTWSTKRAEELGLDISEDMFSLWEPPSQEWGFDLLDYSVKYRDEENNLPPYGMIVVDSISAMPAMYEVDNKMETKSVAYQARNLSLALRKITAGMGDVIIIFINQVRDNLSQYGGPTVTSGGRARKHYAHYRIELRKEPVSEEREQWSEDKLAYETATRVRVGHFARLRLEKHKLGAPERNIKLYFSYDLGDFDSVQDIKQFLTKRGLIWQHSAQFWGVKGLDKKIRGKKGLDSYLRDNPEHVNELIEEAKAMVV